VRRRQVSEDFLLSAGSADGIAAAQSQLQTIEGVQVLGNVGDRNVIVRVPVTAVQQLQDMAKSVAVLLSPFNEVAEWFIGTLSAEQLKGVVQAFQGLGIELVRIIRDRLGDRQCIARATPSALVALLAVAPKGGILIAARDLMSDWLISAPTESQLNAAVQQFPALNIEIIRGIGNLRSEIRATPAALEGLISSPSGSDLLLAPSGKVSLAPAGEINASLIQSRELKSNVA